MPSERTKGVVLCRTAFGNVLIGPTAEEQDDRVHAQVSDAELSILLDKATAIVPALDGMPVTAVYAGLRPASDQKHYRIHHLTERNYLAVGGIRSTGMTAALGIARHVAHLLGRNDPTTTAPPSVALPMLAEHAERDWSRAGYDENRLPLRTGDAPRDRGRARRAPASARPFRPEAAHPLRHGPLPGVSTVSGRLAELTAGRLAHPMSADIPA